jgi:hypothetical protein
MIRALLTGGTFYVGLATVSLVGCAASPMPPAATAASARKALIAQPCAETPANPEAGARGYARVFIQAAQVVSGDLRQPLDGWIIDRPVGTASVASFLASKDEPMTVAWNRCLDTACETSEPWKMTVTPALPARASEPIVLTMQLRGEQTSEDRALSKTLQTRNQQPVVVDLGGAVAASTLSLVVTPYLVGDDDDLRRLAECKSTAAAADDRQD